MYVQIWQKTRFRCQYFEKGFIIRVLANNHRDEINLKNDINYNRHLHGNFVRKYIFTIN